MDEREIDELKAESKQLAKERDWLLAKLAAHLGLSRAELRGAMGVAVHREKRGRSA